MRSKENEQQLFYVEKGKKDELYDDRYKLYVNILCRIYQPRRKKKVLFLIEGKLTLQVDTCKLH